jgi:hypothetical protein
MALSLFIFLINNKSVASGGCIIDTKQFGKAEVRIWSNYNQEIFSEHEY